MQAFWKNIYEETYLHCLNAESYNVQPAMNMYSFHDISGLPAKQKTRYVNFKYSEQGSFTVDK